METDTMVNGKMTSDTEEEPSLTLMEMSMSECGRTTCATVKELKSILTEVSTRECGKTI